MRAPSVISPIMTFLLYPYCSKSEIALESPMMYRLQPSGAELFMMTGAPDMVMAFVERRHLTAMAPPLSSARLYMKFPPERYISENTLT